MACNVEKSTRLLFFVAFCLNIRLCFTDLTGVHYLHTINCSSSLLYLPQGPYLFSHHWPFTSITVQYQKQFTTGACYRDGSLYFVLNSNKICSGIYYGGQAKLLCRYENEDYCLIDMKTSDGRRLTCDGRRVQSMTIGSIGFILFVLSFHKNRFSD